MRLAIKNELQIVNFEDLAKDKDAFSGCDYMFSTFGTTRKDAGGAVFFVPLSYP